MFFGSHLFNWLLIAGLLVVISNIVDRVKLS